MLQYIAYMGPFGIYVSIILGIIFLFGLKNAFLLFIKRPHENLSKLGRSINSMFFWGAIIVVLGFIGTLLSMQTAIESFLHPNSDIRVMFGGFFNILYLPVYSLTSFTIISIVWYIYTGQHRRLLERSMKEKYVTE